MEGRIFFKFEDQHTVRGDLEGGNLLMPERGDTSAVRFLRE